MVATPCNGVILFHRRRFVLIVIIVAGGNQCRINPVRSVEAGILQVIFVTVLILLVIMVLQNATEKIELPTGRIVDQAKKRTVIPARDGSTYSHRIAESARSPCTLLNSFYCSPMPPVSMQAI
jgi:hypothetical protein